MNGFTIFMSIFSIVILLIIYIVGLFLNELSNKGVFYGVRTPLGYEKHENLQKIKKEYRRKYKLSFLAFIAVYFLLFFAIKKYAVSIFIIFLFASIFLMYVNYYFAYKKVKEIKKDEEWKFESGKVVVVELKGRNTALSSKSKLSNWWYLIPIAITVVSSIIAAKESIFILAVAQIITTLTLLGTNYVVYSAKKQLNGGEAHELKEQNRKFRYTLSLFIYMIALSTNLSFLIEILAYGNIISSTFWFCSVAVAFVPVIFILIGSLLMGQSGKNLPTEMVNDEDKIIINRDDDENYILGCFYYNKNDPATFVEKRLGVGMDLNYAKRGSKVFIGIVLGIITATIAFTFCIPSFTKEPKLTLEDKQIVIQGMYGIEIPYENIDKLEIKNNLPKDMFKTNGAAVDNIEIGNFRSKSYGDCKLYIMNDTKAFLLITEKNGTPVLINYEDDARTTKLYEEIANKLRK